MRLLLHPFRLHHSRATVSVGWRLVPRAQSVSGAVHLVSAVSTAILLARTCRTRLLPGPRTAFRSSLSAIGSRAPAMPKPRHPELSPDAIAELAVDRQLKKEQRQAALAREEEERGRILPREWVTVQEAPSTGKQFRIMTWNVRILCILCTEPYSNVICSSFWLSPWSVSSIIMKRTAEVYLHPGRELFPTSDCLKAAQREHMIYREIISHNADICCLQE